MVSNEFVEKFVEDLLKKLDLALKYNICIEEEIVVDMDVGEVNVVYKVKPLKEVGGNGW